nr:uncharacterized protein LOC109617549 [Crassostrea gigas]
MNSEKELIYIDEDYNINKLSQDMNTTTTFIEAPYSTWTPGCLYWSPFTRDLLVGMNYYREGKVTRYNQSRELTQTISQDNSGLQLYNALTYVTENNNWDVVVSDETALVVTERGGRYRFSYTGHPIGSWLLPRGICTDALSHILVCVDKTKPVQMIDRDGQFMPILLTKSQLIGKPCSLSYDVNTHSLWVGSYNNKVYVYRYIGKEDALTSENRLGTDGDTMSSSTSAVEY